MSERGMLFGTRERGNIRETENRVIASLLACSSCTILEEKKKKKPTKPYSASLSFST